MKLQGSCKIGKVCPAMISVHDQNPEVHVGYYNVHYGHDFDLRHIPLSKKDREEIAEQLAQNISFNEVLENIKGKLSDDEISRLHLLHRQDLANIVRDFKWDTNDSHVDTLGTDSFLPLVKPSSSDIDNELDSKWPLEVMKPNPSSKIEEVYEMVDELQTKLVDPDVTNNHLKVDYIHRSLSALLSFISDSVVGLDKSEGKVANKKKTANQEESSSESFANVELSISKGNDNDHCYTK